MNGFLSAVGASVLARTSLFYDGSGFADLADWLGDALLGEETR